MIILVYLESIAWDIIANEVAYVKYKKMYIKQKQVLNCRVSPPSHTILAMMHMYGTAYGGMSSAKVYQ